MTEVSRAASSDAKALCALHGRCFPAGWSARDIAGLLGQPGVVGFATDSGLGFVLIRRVVDEAEILTICVDPSARGHGEGASLLHAAISEVRQQGAKTVFLDVSTRNAAAQALYRRAGFVETGQRPGYYSDGSDALLMSLHLS